MTDRVEQPQGPKGRTGARTGSEPRTATPRGTQGLPSTLGSFLIDGRGIVLGFDLRMEALTGWPAVEVVGRHKDLAGARDTSGGYAAVNLRPLYDGALPVVPSAGAGFELKLQCRDGRTLDVEATARPLGGPGGRVSISVHRVLALTNAPGRLDRGETRDRLTGLDDRASFLARLGAELTGSATAARPMTLIIADIDHLRRINDRLGRAAGDEVLRKLAGLLRAVVGENDLLARLGDDDFAILLRGAGRGESRQLAARLRSNMEQVRFLCGRSGSEPLRVTLSLGSASYPADAETDADLLERAREALDEARTLGRNRVWSYARRARIQVKTPVYFDGAEPQIVGFSRDLSPSGMFVQTPTPLDAGMRCALAFPLPGTEENVHVIGRVVRAIDPEEARDSEQELQPGMGIEFERFGPEDRLAIETYLHQLMVRSSRGGQAAS
jgi:uncharacterized protein (TIGR02266 family)